MGAENSVLEGCNWAEKLPCPNGFQWNISPVSKNDGMEAVVFQPKKCEKKDNNLLQKSSQMLKSLRHPNFVRFLGSGTSHNGFWLATEPVTPLLNFTSHAGLTSYDLIGGVWDILQALDFLHSKLGVCHNNICPNSIFVSKDGSWKFAGMEHACKFLEATPDFLESTRAFRNEGFLAPEEKAGTMKLDMAHPHARDVFAVGACVAALMDNVTDNSSLLEELEKQLIHCVSPDPGSRPSVSALLNVSIFRSDFLDMTAFIKNVTVKTDKEKKDFFSSLLPKLRQLPEEVIARKLVLPLLSRFVLLDETAEKFVVPSLLTPCNVKSESVGLLSEPLFQSYVIPHLCNVFRVHDCHIRLVLLTHFHLYVSLFSREQLEEDIFLQILIGIRDTDDRLVAASLRALADLVPILGGDFVIGGSRKSFFFHGIPKPISSEQLPHVSVSSQQVTDVLSPTRIHTQRDPNHKPLLKDLAAGVTKGTILSHVTPEEKERKNKEKERRREEARLKREERRMKAKTKMMSAKIDEDRNDNCDNGPSSLTIEKFAALEMDKDTTALETTETLEVEEIRDSSPISPKEEEEEEALVEDEKGDWSDWEDADGNISDEIEEELKNMSDGSFSENKVQTSPSPYEIEDTLDRRPLVKVDWSDVPNNVLSDHPKTGKDSKGPLCLGKKNEKEESVENDTGGNSKPYDSVESEWNNEMNCDNNALVDVLDTAQNSATGAKALKLKNLSSAHSTTSNKSSSKKPPPKHSDDLGLEYDIKSVEIKSKSKSLLEDDLFADMAPVISKPNSDPIQDLMGTMATTDPDISKPKTDKRDESTKQGISSSLFAVESLAQEEEESGWGDEGDGWDTEDF